MKTIFGLRAFAQISDRHWLSVRRVVFNESRVVLGVGVSPVGH